MSYDGTYRDDLAGEHYLICRAIVPEWRNWQTQGTENRNGWDFVSPEDTRHLHINCIISKQESRSGCSAPLSSLSFRFAGFATLE